MGVVRVCGIAGLVPASSRAVGVAVTFSYGEASVKRQSLLALRAVAVALAVAAAAFLLGCGSTTSSASSAPDGSVGDGAACTPSTAGGVGSNSAGYGCSGSGQDTAADAA